MYELSYANIWAIPNTDLTLDQSGYTSYLYFLKRIPRFQKLLQFNIQLVLVKKASAYILSFQIRLSAASGILALKPGLRNISPILLKQSPHKVERKTAIPRKL